MVVRGKFEMRTHHLQEVSQNRLHHLHKDRGSALYNIEKQIIMVSTMRTEVLDGHNAIRFDCRPVSYKYISEECFVNPEKSDKKLFCNYDFCVFHKVVINAQLGDYFVMNFSESQISSQFFFCFLTHHIWYNCLC